MGKRKQRDIKQNVIHTIKHLEGKIQMEYDEKYEMERMARQ